MTGLTDVESILVKSCHAPTTQSPLLRDLYTCFVGSCQNEVKHFSPISATISRESYCLVTGAGEKVSEMNNWCCEMDRFPSVGSWSHCVLHYLEWGVHCALSAIPSYCFFLHFCSPSSIVFSFCPVYSLSIGLTLTMWCLQYIFWNICLSRNWLWRCIYSVFPQNIL